MGEAVMRSHLKIISATLAVALAGGMTLPLAAEAANPSTHKPPTFRQWKRAGHGFPIKDRLVARAASTGAHDWVNPTRCQHKIEYAKYLRETRHGIPPGAQVPLVRRCIRHHHVGNQGATCLVRAGFAFLGVAATTFLSGGTLTPVAVQIGVTVAGLACAESIVTYGW